MTEQHTTSPSHTGPAQPSLMQRYRALAQGNQLQYDAAQNLVIEALQLLSNRLQNYTPPPKIGFISSLFGQQPDHLKGLYIFGGVGTGKTMLMNLFYDSLIVPQKQRQHFSVFMEQVHQEIKAFREEQIQDPITAVAEKIRAKTLILCLDEFQVTDITDAMILGRLFEALFAKGLVLVTTGNIAPQNLYADGLNRALFLPFLDLLALHTDVIALDTGKDYRRFAIEKHSLWHLTAQGENNTSYLNQWQALTAGFTPVPDVINVNGRDLNIPLAAGKIARFSFEDLCAQPLGRADYLAIAQKYHTIFIDDIPLLDKGKKNEGRRFTLLIDTLYDQGRILIASAHAAPDHLYQPGIAPAEFKRTISRLLEMSSQSYIKNQSC